MKKNALFILSLFIIPFYCFSQPEKSDFKFKIIKELKTTSVKNQQQTGTCWSFATTSFIETEAIRLGNDSLDLSEMFFVRHTYTHKGLLYVDSAGNNRFSGGGLSHDVMKVYRDFGCVPQAVYSGKNHCETIHYHNELTSVLTGILDGITKSKQKTMRWFEVYNNTLDYYLGYAPKYFHYRNKIYTPKQFAREIVGVKAEDYVEITSFSDHPFYKQYELNIPDNWSHDLYYNIPIEDLMEIMHHAIENGFSIVWDGDVSEKEFNHEKSIAVLPKKAWSKKNDKQKKQTFISYEPEKKVTQELRQKTFEDKTTTDDHLMHITGIAEDLKGNKYFVTKNSWGPVSNTTGGYLYMSEMYVKLKTISILIHKDAIPVEIRKKMQL